MMVDQFCAVSVTLPLLSCWWRRRFFCDTIRDFSSKFRCKQTTNYTFRTHHYCIALPHYVRWTHCIRHLFNRVPLTPWIRYILLTRTQRLTHQWLITRYCTVAKAPTMLTVSCRNLSTRNHFSYLVQRNNSRSNLQIHIHRKCWKWHRLKSSHSQSRTPASSSVRSTSKMSLNTQLPTRFVRNAASLLLSQILDWCTGWFIALSYVLITCVFCLFAERMWLHRLDKDHFAG